MLEKNEFIETSSIKFGEIFFFSLSLFEINFSNILIAFCSELTINTYMYIYITRKFKSKSKSIEFPIKWRKNIDNDKLIFNFAFNTKICLTREEIKALNLSNWNCKKIKSPENTKSWPPYIHPHLPNPNHPFLDFYTIPEFVQYLTPLRTKSPLNSDFQHLQNIRYFPKKKN